MTDTEKAKVSLKANPEHDGPLLVVHHKAYSYRTKDGRTVHVRAHEEVNPQLSESRKREARKLKTPLEPRAAPARKERPAKKEAKPAAEGASAELVRLAKAKAKEAAHDGTGAAPAAEAKVDGA